MAWIAADSLAQGSGGGGGGSSSWATYNKSESSAWVGGVYTITLPTTPSDPDAVFVNFNNGNLTSGTDYSISGPVITILFDFDPADVGIASANFQIKYQS